jgi:hypothetical protein
MGLIGYWKTSRKEEKDVKNSKKNEETGELSSIDAHDTEIMLEEEDKYISRIKIGSHKRRPPILIMIGKTLPDFGVQISDVQA